jgi:hypothetical protein
LPGKPKTRKISRGDNVVFFMHKRRVSTADERRSTRIRKMRWKKIRKGDEKEERRDRKLFYLVAGFVGPAPAGRGATFWLKMVILGRI